MEQERFKALVVREKNKNEYVRLVEERNTSDLPENEVLIKVLYSSLNYKDALSASGNPGVTRRYPHTPGIDAAGIVMKSSVPEWKAGDEVVVSCYDLGMNTAGGFGQYIRVPARWVMSCPAGISLKESMIYGTGGFTAAHSILRLQRHGVRPDDGKILVTGATGGVGSFSVAIMARLGYRVVAASGKASARRFLTDLGAEEIVGREELQDTSGRLVLKGKWAGVVDTVGGSVLATAIKTTRYGGAVTCCGNVAEAEFVTNVYPFILRGISLIGIDSAECPMALRKEIWELMGDAWRPDMLTTMAREIPLTDLSEAIDKMLAGQLTGRVVVNLWG